MCKARQARNKSKIAMLHRVLYLDEPFVMAFMSFLPQGENAACCSLINYAVGDTFWPNELFNFPARDINPSAREL